MSEELSSTRVGGEAERIAYGTAAEVNDAATRWLRARGLIRDAHEAHREMMDGCARRRRLPEEEEE